MSKAITPQVYPPSLSFWSALQKGYVRGLKSGGYLHWVRHKPCVMPMCGRQAQAHHLVGHGLKAVGGKVSDYMTFPLCELHHSPQSAGSLHHLGHEEWERLHGDQRIYVFQTLIQAVHEGIVTFG